MSDTILFRVFSDFLSLYLGGWVWVGILLEIGFIVLLSLAYFRFPFSWVSIFFEFLFESVYHFFEDILWEGEKKSIKLYITLLFFIIIFANLGGIVLEFLMPIFWESLEHSIKNPTTDINFNIAMAIIWITIVLKEQWLFLWTKKFVYEYFPIVWKKYLYYARWHYPPLIDGVFYILISIFDIIISVFLGALEIVWLLAKIISLSFRLFWNMTSGGILLVMLMGWLSTVSIKMIGFDFPILFPLIIYIQEILVACIQAFVFPLLVAIFIKVAKLH